MAIAAFITTTFTTPGSITAAPDPAVPPSHPAWVRPGTEAGFEIAPHVEGTEPEAGVNHYEFTSVGEGVARVTATNDLFLSAGPGNEFLDDPSFVFEVAPDRTIVASPDFAFWLWVPPLEPGQTVRVFNEAYTVGTSVTKEGRDLLVLTWEGVEEETLAYMQSTLHYDASDRSLVFLQDEYEGREEGQAFTVTLTRTRFVEGPVIEEADAATSGVNLLPALAAIALAGSAGALLFARRRRGGRTVCPTCDHHRRPSDWFSTQCGGRLT